MIRAIEDLIPNKKKDKVYVFLAGPIQGAEDWQDSDYMFNLENEYEGKIELINPRRKQIDNNFDWNDQVTWETKGLRMCDIILFWIPREMESIPGRDYAQTTKIELTENLCRGKNIILGIEDGVNTKRYLESKAKSYGISKIYDNLAESLNELRKYLDKEVNSNNTFFTSDTHFGSTRALELSKRPFRSVSEMDWTIIERWNKVIGPKDVVYHLGDFGDRNYLKYLNGEINLLCGNYEQDEIDKHWDNFDDFRKKLEDLGFSKIYPYRQIVNFKNLSLNHEPLFLKNKISDFGLFGHIHGRQKIKQWGIDVGVDCNNFTPMSESDVSFYINALQKGYYDENVFC